jgi:hypothetical protein
VTVAIDFKYNALLKSGTLAEDDLYRKSLTENGLASVSPSSNGANFLRVALGEPIPNGANGYQPLPTSADLRNPQESQTSAC